MKNEKRPPSPGKMLAKKTGTLPQQKPVQLPPGSTPHIIAGRVLYLGAHIPSSRRALPVLKSHGSGRV